MSFKIVPSSYGSKVRPVLYLAVPRIQIRPPTFRGIGISGRASVASASAPPAWALKERVSFSVSAAVWQRLEEGWRLSGKKRLGTALRIPKSSLLSQRILRAIRSTSACATAAAIERQIRLRTARAAQEKKAAVHPRLPLHSHLPSPHPFEGGRV